MIGGGAASYLAYLLFDHVRVRVLAWQDPWKYIDSKGYQITQSLFAIGSGSWFGMGLLKVILPRFRMWKRISFFIHL